MPNQEAVSYTHLDVYKRQDQAYLWAAQARLDEASGNKDKAIQAWEEALRQTPRCV